MVICEIKKLDFVDSLCYLGDTTDAGGSCELSVIMRVQSVWGKFLQLLPILTSFALLYTTRGHIYSTYIHPVLLYASECWAPSAKDLLEPERNDCAMVQWICNVHLKDHIRSDSLLKKLSINNIKRLLWYYRLRWFGYVARNNGCIYRTTALEVHRHSQWGRPKKTWRDTINNDRKNWKLLRVDPMNWIEWTKKLRINMGTLRPTLSGTSTLNKW